MTGMATVPLPSSDILQETMKDGMKEREAPPVPGEGACPSYTPTLGADDGGRMKDASPATPPVQPQPGVVIVSSADALVRARNRVGDAVTAQIWGLHVRARAVTLFVGQTSAGKTTFLHNLAFHLSTGREFVGITPPRPCRVLVLDFESYDDLLAEHLEAIGTAEGWDFLDLESVQDKRGGELVKIIEARVREDRYDVVIVDPIMEAFPVKDENDNALAELQMRAFRQLARGTGAAVVLAHNSGLRTSRTTSRGRQGVAQSPFLGRGATTRVDRSDVAINFTAPTDSERLLFVAKSRARNFRESIRVRFAGEYGYEVIGESAPMQQRVTDAMQSDVLRVAREEAAEGRPIVERKAFMEKLGIEKGSREQTLDRALKRCVEKDKTLVRADGGGYSLVPSRTPTTITEDDLKGIYTDPALLDEIPA